MATKAALAAYLNDHLAGATMGVDLARSCRDRHQGTALGAYLESLVGEIAADRDVLRSLTERLGIERSTVKQAAGWVAEKLSRVAFDSHLVGDDNASALLQLEALSLGIEGKGCLWSALQALAGADERLQEVDFAALVERAAGQRAGLEQHRVVLAATALAG